MIPANTPATQEARFSSLQRRVLVGAGLVFLLTAGMSVGNWHGPDYAIDHFINRFVQRSYLFDHAMVDLTKDVFSNLLIVSLVWYAWFGNKDLLSRAGIIIGLIAAWCAGMLSRVLQLVLPTHLRPLHDPALQFRLPLAVDSNSLNHWSSFPSDHAAVFFGLAMTVFLANRKLGWVIWPLTILLNCVRIYLGYHYPSDVLGGAMLGILAVTAAHSLRTQPRLQRLAAVPPRYEPLFYAVAFYISFGIVTLMQDWRDVAAGLVHHLHHHGG